MNSLRLAVQNLIHRRLQTIVILLVLSLTSVLFLVFHFGSRAFFNSIVQESKQVDAVLGAKGSPIQLVMSTVKFSDFPTGNIPLSESSQWVETRAIKEAIPLSIGDSYLGFPIVGTTPNYSQSIFETDIVTGRSWKEPFEVVLGASISEKLNLSIDSTFFSIHGMGEEGMEHNHPFVVTGILGKSNSVLDNLILTSLESVWEAHEEHNHHHDHKLDTITSYHNTSDINWSQFDSDKEITAWLLKFRSPFLRFEYFRTINADTRFLVVNPVRELNNLLTWLGLGIDSLKVITLLVSIITYLSISLILLQQLFTRVSDFALLKAVGRSNFFIFKTIFYEITLLVIGAFLISLISFLIVWKIWFIQLPIRQISLLLSFDNNDLFIPLFLVVIIFSLSIIPIIYLMKIPTATILTRSSFVLLISALLSFPSELNAQKKNLWKTWDKISRVDYDYINLGGEEIKWPVPVTSVKKLDGEEIEIRGYLILEYADFKHELFFLSKVPETQCYFCGGAGLESIMYVYMDEPIERTKKPVSLRGTFRVNTVDPDRTLYELHHAELIKD